MKFSHCTEDYKHAQSVSVESYASTTKASEAERYLVVHLILCFEMSHNVAEADRAGNGLAFGGCAAIHAGLERFTVSEED